MAKDTKNTPYIPTGYEGQLAGIKQKRELAKALTEQGLTGRIAPHYADLFGTLAQSLTGAYLDKDASRDEEALNTQRLADYKNYNTEIATALAGMGENPDPVATLSKVMANPYAQGNPLVEALAKAAETKLSGQQKFNAPVNVVNPETGKVEAVSFSEAGGMKGLGGIRIPQLEENFGQVVDLTAMGPLRQDPNQRVIYDIAGELIPNEAKIGADMAVASAGRPTTNVNVAAARAWANEVPGAIVERLSEGQKGIDAAVKNFPTMLEMGQVLRQGKDAFFSGSFSNARKNIAKVASLMGVSTEEAERRIANTETIVRANMPMIAEIMRVFGGSDTIEELRIAQEATAGKDISYEGAMRVYEAAMRSLQNSNQFHNRNVDRALEAYPNDDYVRSGIQTFRSELPEDMRQAVQKELVRMKYRRERGQ